MELKTNVYVRQQKLFHKVAITSENKPNIEKTIYNSWQRIINLIVRVFDAPVGLIMKISEDSLEVFVKNNSEDNFYKLGEKSPLGTGTYCENVIGTNSRFMLENANTDEVWKDNPDAERGMISYYGLPLKWPDKEVFGSICVLDNKPNVQRELYFDILNELRFAIEKDLDLLLKQQQMREIANTDIPTSVYNRRRIGEIINDEFERTTRSGVPFSVALIDIDYFKDINDTYGHEVGDRILKTLACSINSRIRSIDSFGRWGGDEFVLVCPNTDRVGMHMLFDKVYDAVIDELSDIVNQTKFSYGCSEYYYKDATSLEIIKRADQELYKSKTENN